MAKRAGRFDPLPTSEQSDPALLSHRSIDSAAVVIVAAPSQQPSSNGLLLPESHQLNDDEEEEEELLCGLGRWFSPGWLQPLASKQMFLAVFCLACVLQGMFFTYFVSVLTTIEKLFQIQSKTTGIIMSATEMGQIGGALLLTYFGGQGHRPKWIGWGMVLFGSSAALCSLPHFLFWRTKPNTGGSGAIVSSAFDTSVMHQDGHDVLMPPSIPQQLEMDLICRQVSNATRAFVVHDAATELERNQECARSSEQQAANLVTHLVLAIFFLSLLGIGMGRTAVETLGIPYLDDNVANRESPTYFAINIGVKILGPVFGFVLGSLCTSIYVDPLVEADVTPTDPRWIGAWWLGMILVSSTILLASLTMFAFPRRLPRRQRSGRRVPQQQQQQLNGGETLKEEQEEKLPAGTAVASAASVKKPSLKDFPKAIRRLLKNDILLLRTASSVLHILPIAGLYTFLPKYLESQFRMAAHVANMISGIGGILVMGIGIFVSGVFIRVKKPSPKFVAAWIAMTALLYSIGTNALESSTLLPILIVFRFRHGPSYDGGLLHGRLCRPATDGIVIKILDPFLFLLL